MRRAIGQVLTAATFCLLAATGVEAAERYEIGLQLSTLHLTKIGEAPVGFGVRFHCQAAPLLAADVEATHYPENPSGNFGETKLLAGIRAGRRIDRFGIFATGRAGVMHFGGDYFALRLREKNHFIVDIGGVLEYYPSPHTFLRIEVGDAFIRYGSARLFDRPNPDPLGTVHNMETGFGAGFRF